MASLSITMQQSHEDAVGERDKSKDDTKRRTAEISGQPDPPVPLTFPVVPPGSTDSRETAVDTIIFHFIQEHADEFLSRETAKSPGIGLLGNLRPSTGFAMAKGVDHVI